MDNQTLYQPVIVRKEINDEHFYFVDGVFYPSVTKILSEALPTPYALRQWLGDVGNEVAQKKMEDAAKQGTLIHNACQSLILGATINLKDQFPKKIQKKMLTGFINWFAAYQPKRLTLGGLTFQPEMIVASRHGYAGTMDFVCEIQGEAYIVDWKTSSGVHDSHKLQVTAYQNAFEEMYGIKPKRGILHLNAKSMLGFTFHDEDKFVIKKTNITINDFLAVMNVYKMLNGGVSPEPPLEDTYPDILKLELV